MKILTWNINGIRATKEPLCNVLSTLDADIICLQETKVTRDQLNEPSAIIEGYNSYFSFSRTKTGYSGVATFVKDLCTPLKAEEGLSGIFASKNEAENVGCYPDIEELEDSLEALDNEGRTIITQHKVKRGIKEELLTVINVYCPRADPERQDRKEYKLKFYRLLQSRAEAILAGGSHVVILGDINTSHKRIDSCDPKEDFDEHPGRHWLDGLLLNTSQHSDKSLSKSGPVQSHQFIDSFRYFYPDKTNAYTCWSTVSGARATNYGTRIDYIFGNIDLVKDRFVNCIIMPDFEGSDHCPVRATLSCELVPSLKIPPLCTKFHPEFMGKQQKLSTFFQRVNKNENIQKTCVNEDEGDLNKFASKSEEVATTSLSCQKYSLKRCGGSQDSRVIKKQKTEPNKVRTKQGNLLNFLTKSSSVSKISTCNNDSSNTSNSRSFIPTSSVTENKKISSEKQCAINSWKNILKGPPPAPLCKGHSEHCVLRTVKKDDSLNKGRQFWVCNRPEGHKTNPAARCDHFVWVQKNNKKNQ